MENWRLTIMSIFYALTELASRNRNSKNITIYMPLDLLETIDEIVDDFSQSSAIGTINRTDFILTACRQAIKEIKKNNTSVE